jgi:hypothetical protein
MRFRTASCIARYVHEHGNADGVVCVTDDETGRLIQARSAIFVKSETDENTKALDSYAFRDAKAAVAFGKKAGGSSSDWPSILQITAISGAN